jgi:hypothetical protein
VPFDGKLVFFLLCLLVDSLLCSVFLSSFFLFGFHSDFWLERSSLLNLEGWLNFDHALLILLLVRVVFFSLVCFFLMVLTLFLLDWLQFIGSGWLYLVDLF